MTKITNLILSIAIIGTVSCSQMSKKAEVLQPPPLQEFTLKNGLKVVVAEDRKLPLVSAHLMVFAGASADPVKKSGLTFMTSELLEKGTAKKTAEEIAEAFAMLGSSFSESVDADFMTFSSETLQSNQSELLQLFSEVVTQPKFDAKEFTLLQKRMIASIQKSFDDPPTVAGYVLDQELMKDYVYSRPVHGTLEDVQKLKLPEVKAQYANLFKPAQSTLVLIGDWDAKVIENLNQYFSEWKANKDPLTDLTVKTKYPEVQPKTVLVTKPGLKQAQIRIGHKGIKRNNEDYWALQVANVILGGNFSSRLMSEVRVKKGLTYSAGSRFQPGLFEGPFFVSTFTRLDKIAETVKASKDVVIEFKDKGATEDEVNRAKNYLKGHLIRNYENPSAIVTGILKMRIYSLPPEEVTHVLQKVSAVDASDVNRAIKKYIQPDQFITVVYAPNETASQLRQLGPIQVKPVRQYLER